MFHPARVSTKRFVTVSDLSRHGRDLSVKCLSCGHTAELSAITLYGHCQPRNRAVLSLRDSRRTNMGLSAIVERLRCSRCGAKKVDWGPMAR